MDMEVFVEKSRLRLTLSRSEGRLLFRILQSVRANYQIEPSALDAKAASVWYSTRGCQTAGMTPAETEEWMASLFRYRSENAETIASWMARLGQKGPQHPQLTLSLEQAHLFLTVLNDHRLFLAARHDLGEEEMRMDAFGGLKKLSPLRQAALCEVGLLAYLMEIILASLPNSGADWRSTCRDSDLEDG